jgi:ParB-like nuclease domain
MNKVTPVEIQFWPIERLVFYARNPRKNDAAVDRMCASIREFGFKIPVLARSDGEVVDGHLRLKSALKLGSWPGGDTTGIPMILCDEWTPAQVKAFRLMVNRSVTWADWDDELLALELQELKESEFDLSLTGFDPHEIDDLLSIQDEDENADTAPPLPENSVSQPGDLWLCGPHRVLCGDATSPEAVAQLLGQSQPVLMVSDPPYGIGLDTEWRDRAGLNGHGPNRPSGFRPISQTALTADPKYQVYAALRHGQPRLAAPQGCSGRCGSAPRVCMRHPGNRGERDRHYRARLQAHQFPRPSSNIQIRRCRW